MQKRKNRKYDLSEKLAVINDYQSGYGSISISHKRKIATSMVKRWIRVYQAQGLKGLDKQARKAVPSDIKHKAVKEIIEKGLSFETVALKYHVSISAVYSWFQRVQKHGYSSLLTIKQGRPAKIMGRPKKKEPETELEKLQEELLYLRAENALLKKLKALEQERIVHASAKQSKPSKR